MSKRLFGGSGHADPLKSPEGQMRAAPGQRLASVLGLIFGIAIAERDVIGGSDQRGVTVKAAPR